MAYNNKQTHIEISLTLVTSNKHTRWITHALIKFNNNKKKNKNEKKKNSNKIGTTLTTFSIKVKSW